MIHFPSKEGADEEADRTDRSAESSGQVEETSRE